jgi:hypothetical protein
MKKYEGCTLDIDEKYEDGDKPQREAAKTSQMCHGHARGGDHMSYVKRAVSNWQLKNPGRGSLENRDRGEVPDANDDFEVVLQRPLDILLEIELSIGRQMSLHMANIVVM